MIHHPDHPKEYRSSTGMCLQSIIGRFEFYLYGGTCSHGIQTRDFLILVVEASADPEAVDRGPGPARGKSQVAIGFLRNTGMDPPREVSKVRTALCEIR